MKIVKLDKEEDSPKVTVELSLREMNVIRDILNRSVVLDEKMGLHPQQIHEGSHLAVQLHQKHRS